MKRLTVAGKASAIILAAVLAGCTGSDTPRGDAAAAEAEAEARRQAREQRVEAEARAAEARAQRRLEEAVAAAGNAVYFDFDKSTLRAETRRVLDAHIALLKTGNRSLRLEGHTDERGTREYNMALGERRARAVADYMSLNGIAGYRIEAVSYGEERPVAIGVGEVNWQRNRRVEIK